MKFLVFYIVSKLCFIGATLGANTTRPLPIQTLNTLSQESGDSGTIRTELGTKTAFVDNKKIVCPKAIERIPFFSLPCDYDSECKVFGKRMVCCFNRCIRGVNSMELEEKIDVERRDKVTTKSPTTTKSTTSTTTTSSSTTTETTITKTGQELSESVQYVCPSKGWRVPLFSLPCDTKNDCLIFGSKMVCCSRRCIQGTPQNIKRKDIHSDPNTKKVTENYKPLMESSDQPIKVDIQSIVPPVKNEIKNIVCPEGARIPFFALLCTNDNDCSMRGEKMVCCKNRCIAGVPLQKNKSNPVVSKTKRVSDETGINEKSENTIENLSVTDRKIPSRNVTTSTLVCPDKGSRVPFFSLPCVVDSDCESSGREMICCSSRCIKGVLPKNPEIVHSPSWFGLVERNCPVDAIVEILEIKECQSDSDCRPRICCPDKYRNGGNKSYCRTPQPSLHRFPLAERATEPLRVFASYIQCTPPPPPIFDLFPKSCNNALDCFPNLCCQEGDKKYCRPPKRSVLQLIAGVGQRFVPADAAKRLIERLN